VLFTSASVNIYCQRKYMRHVMRLAHMSSENRTENPIIAKVFYRAGIIKRCSMGTLNIIDWCAENGNPPTSWQEQAGSLFVTFFPAVSEEAGTKLALSRHQVEILHKCREDSVLVDLMAIAERSDRTKFRHQVLSPLLEAGLIEMTIPNKPRSSKQRYRLTEKGRQFLRGLQKGNK